MRLALSLRSGRPPWPEQLCQHRRYRTVTERDPEPRRDKRKEQSVIKGDRFYSTLKEAGAFRQADAKRR
jgi:hypothetical protein